MKNLIQKENTKINDIEIKFAPGQLVLHKLFGYRGVILDIDEKTGKARFIERIQEKLQ